MFIAFYSILFKYTFSFQNNGCNIHISKKNVRFCIMEKRSTLHTVCITILHNLYSVFNEIKTDMGHYSRIGHVAYVNLCHLHISIFILF